jgi:hypothetical protein
MGIYVASKASNPERPAMWRRLRKFGVPIISSWIDEAGPGETECLSQLWSRIESEIHLSQALIIYAESEDFPLKGALVEVGMAITARVPIFATFPNVCIDPQSCRPVGSWIRHPSVTVFKDLHKAIVLARGVIAR